MTTEEKILEIINDELNAHNQSMPSLIARENIATKINFLFEQEFSEQKPDLNNQIDDIEKEDFLNIIFNELQKDAYDAEYHTYDFKRTNQIIREYFEEYAQQFQKPEINLRDEPTKGIGKVSECPFTNSEYCSHCNSDECMYHVNFR